ncbi:MAG TPA: RNA methyltransferase [Solirubrobacteraceae bacterium]|jgi:TrmH family RNA methyltransferase
MSPETITSPNNPQLKALRRLQAKRERERSGRFMAEGEDLVTAARVAERPVVVGFRLAGSGLCEGEGFLDVSETLLGGVSALGSGSRVIGVYEQRWAKQPAGPLCVYLHGVGDPGNVGTVIRAAQAFGASCVALGPDCADPHSPKAVRASMGAIFSVALARASGPDDLPGTRVALVADAPETLGAVLEEIGDKHVSLLVGAERDGLPAEVMAACERRARIPIASESLNAAMAATVALYETTREPSRVTAS